VQTGGPGDQTSVFIRGTNSNHVKVLIDGIDASDPSNPNQSFDLGQLLTGDIARIEVLRGPQSAGLVLAYELLKVFVLKHQQFVT
jgi:vitamin B12 transporter